MRCDVPSWSASSRSAGSKPWSRSTTGSSANERSRSSRIVARWRSSAEESTLRASSSLPTSIECSAASSISAIPARFCTGPSWRKSAIRRRSSCSAAIRRSSASSVNDRFAQGDRDGVSSSVGLELREDVPNVALHGLLRDEESPGNIRVRHPVGEELQDLSLARGEHVGLVLAREERRHQRGVDVALALRNLLDRAHERLVRGLLEDVALRARLQPTSEKRPLRVRSEDQHLR